MVQFWTESKSYAKVQRQWAKHFNLTGRKSKTCVPDRQVIKRAVDRFNDTGSIQVIKKGRSGNKRHVRTPEKIAEIRESVKRSPRKSLEIRRQEVGVSKPTAWRVLKDVRYSL